MEGDGSCDSTSPSAPLPEPDGYLEPVIFEPVPPGETVLEPDPDVVLENLFRNSIGTRRKSLEARKKPARRPKSNHQPTLPSHHSDDYVQEISSDSDGSPPDYFPTPVSAPTPKNPTDFEFVDTVDVCPTNEDQPLEEDPLGGEEPVPGEGTVSDPLSDSPLVPVPQDSPLSRVIPVDVPLSNGVNPPNNEEHSASIDHAVPGSQSLNGPFKNIKKRVNYIDMHPQTTNITISTALETTSISDFSTLCENDDLIEVEIDKGPPNGPNASVYPGSVDPLDSQVPRPISQPSGILRPVPFDILSGRPLNDKKGRKPITMRQTATPTSSNCHPKFVPIPPQADTFPAERPSIQAGSNVVVVMMPDGSLETVPLQSLDPSVLDGHTSSCSSDVSIQPEEPLGTPLATTTTTGKPKRRPRKPQPKVSPMTSANSTGKPRGRARKSQPGVSPATTTQPKRRMTGKPKKSELNIPPDNSKSLDPLAGVPLSSSMTDTDPLSIPVKLEKDPLEGPEQDVIYPKQEENSPMALDAPDATINDIPPADAEPDIESFLDKPSTTGPKPLKRPAQPLWPPPNLKRPRKRKLEPRIPLPVAQIPLSGSWTNPNPVQSTENDILGGLVDTVNGHCESSRYKATKSTQYYSLGHDVALREAAGLETKDVRRPQLTIRGYGIDVPSKQMVYNLYRYFEQRRTSYNLHYVSTELIEVATGMKASTVQRILREAKRTCDDDDFKSMPQFTSIDKRRNRVKYKVSNLKIDMALRECLMEHFLKKKETLGLMALSKKCNGVLGTRKSQNNWSFVRLRIKTLGYVSMRTLRKKVHVEGAAVRAWRHNYLTQLAKVVENRKNIVFTLVVDMLEGAARTAEDEWAIMESENEIKQERRVLTVFHAANKPGYLDDGLFIKDVTRNRMNSTSDNYYSEWLELHVLKKIPKDSVVVLAHQQFHSMKDMEMKPNEGCSKKEIIDWLKSRVIGDFDESTPKCVLLDKVSRIPVERGYCIDSLVKMYGHTPLHLFPFQKDLNPLEYVWEDIRSRFHKHRTLQFTKDQLKSAFDSNAPIFKSGWERCEAKCEYYFNKDPLLEEAQEIAVKKLGGVWSPLIAKNQSTQVFVNEDNEPEEDSASVNSPAKSNKSESDSDSDSDSDSSQSDSDSDSDSDDTTSSESGDDDGDDNADDPPPEQIDDNKTVEEEKTETGS